jgi:hypothetical protein
LMLISVLPGKNSSNSFHFFPCSATYSSRSISSCFLHVLETMDGSN